MDKVIILHSKDNLKNITCANDPEPLCPSDINLHSETFSDSTQEMRRPVKRRPQAAREL